MANYDIHANSHQDFETTIKQLVNQFDIKSIVETGTYHGNGSTSVLARTGLRVTTFECNPQNNYIAKNNLRPYLNVDAIWGYSLPLKDMVEFIKNDDIYEKKIAGVTGEGDNPESAKWGYTNELGNLSIPQGLLRAFGDVPERQIIFLDSAGGVGYAEFKEFLKFEHLKNKVLVLDDVPHVKHYRSSQDILAMGKEFNRFSDGRGGWTSFIE